MTSSTCTAAAPHHCLSRRAAMAAGGAAATAVLAACSGGTPPPSTGDPDAVPVTLGTIDDIPIGGAITASSEVAGDLLLTRPAEGEVHAFSAVCTHAGCAVEAGEGELNCPCHGSVFDLATGEPVRGPATDPLPEVTIEVGEDGSILG